MGSAVAGIQDPASGQKVCQLCGPENRFEVLRPALGSCPHPSVCAYNPLPADAQSSRQMLPGLYSALATGSL